MFLKVTFSDAELAAIDDMRDGVPRATFVRRVVWDAAVAAGVLADVRETPPLKSTGDGYVSPFVGRGARSSNLKDVL